MYNDFIIHFPLILDFVLFFFNFTKPMKFAEKKKLEKKYKESQIEHMICVKWKKLHFVFINLTELKWTEK